jgi:phosphate transport system substrate-binding protein
MADELHYVPMPANVIKDIQEMWAREIKDDKGQPVLAVTN